MNPTKNLSSSEVTYILDFTDHSGCFNYSMTYGNFENSMIRDRSTDERQLYERIVA